MIQRLLPLLIAGLVLAGAGLADAARSLPWFTAPVVDLGPLPHVLPSLPRPQSSDSGEGGTAPAPEAEPADTEPAAEPAPTPSDAAAVEPAPEAAVEPPAASDAPATPRRPQRKREATELVAVGGPVVVAADTTVDAAVAVFGSVRVDGTVHGEAVSVFGPMTINGTVEGDVVCMLGTLTLGPAAVIEGDVIVPIGNAVIDPGAWIGGERVVGVVSGVTGFEEVPVFLREGLFLGRVMVPGVGWMWLAAAALLALYILTAIVLKRPVEVVTDVAVERAGTSFAVGFLVAALFGPVSLVLLATVLGLIAVPFLIAGVLFATWMGRVAACACVSRQIGLGSLPPALQVIPGFLLLLAVYMIPIVGLFVWAMIGLFGTGAATLALFAALRREGPPAAVPPVPPVPPVAPPPEPAAAPSAAGAAAFVASDPVGGVVPPEPPSTPEPPPLATPPAAPGPVPGGASMVAGPPLPRAGFWIRVLPFLVDIILVAVVSGVVFNGAVFFPLLVLYYVVMWAWKGTTIGGAVLRLRVRRSDGYELTWGTALVRVLGMFVSAVPLGLGFFWCGWTDERLTWHDNIAGTEVVRLPPGTRMF